MSEVPLKLFRASLQSSNGSNSLHVFVFVLMHVSHFSKLFGEGGLLIIGTGDYSFCGKVVGVTGVAGVTGVTRVRGCWGHCNSSMQAAGAQDVTQHEFANYCHKFCQTIKFSFKLMLNLAAGLPSQLWPYSGS